MPKNTKLTTMYRDADNYKSTSCFVLEGTLKEDQWKQLVAAGEDFVAHEFGLENPAFNFREYDSFPNDETDHGCNTVVEIEEHHSFERVSKECLTDEPPTNDLTVQSFLKQYLNRGNDFDSEFSRMCSEA